MTYKIEVQCDPRWSELEAPLKRAAIETLNKQSAESGTLSLVLIDSDGIRDLNRTYAGDDHPTDVLSFVDGSPDPDSGTIYFGDVVIAIDIAQAQAKTAGHPLGSELSLLCVHGILHLLGHDHSRDEDKVRMWSAQEDILDSLGVETGNVDYAE